MEMDSDAEMVLFILILFFCIFAQNDPDDEILEQIQKHISVDFHRDKVMNLNFDQHHHKLANGFYFVLGVKIALQFA